MSASTKEGNSQAESDLNKQEIIAAFFSHIFSLDLQWCHIRCHATLHWPSATLLAPENKRCFWKLLILEEMNFHSQDVDKYLSDNISFPGWEPLWKH